ncbi:DUF2577 family protein [Metaclostridioides mangenotii]|uniref:DUF2577 domain-containing protein n=1 Tax=Metaclostridioides mangenotii TaxID=1540 RepID=A0ABS4E911_9FIRM|nr:DUF2577 family protein [Clostridioides mangenotii]MBP1854433.1 hypothetical protein [Clostridioides mangenotii]
MADAINDLIGIMREEGNVNYENPFLIGVITRGYPDIMVKIGNIELSKQNLMIDKWLLDRNDVRISSSQDNITHNISDRIEEGDKVIMIKSGEKYIITNKVVNL